MKEEMRHIDITGLDLPPEHRQLFVYLINMIEELVSEKTALTKRVAELEDIIKNMQGEQGRPDIGKKEEPSDISSKGKEKGEKKDSPIKEDKVSLEIDRDMGILHPSVEDLPMDAKLSSYRQVIIQDIQFKRDNVGYTLAVYYSASEQKTYSAKLPLEHQFGGYGSNLRALIQILNRSCHVTEGNIEKLLEGLNIKISSGTISNILLEASDWVYDEQKAILSAGIAGSTYASSDSTQNKEKGVAKKSHIIVGLYFVVYYTLGSKARLDIIRALLGNPVQGLEVIYNDIARQLFNVLKVSQEDQLTLSKLLREGEKMNLREFIALIKEQAPTIFAKKNMFTRIQEALVLGYYHTQGDFPIVDTLLSDDAPEYQKIARLIHALCWVHDARHYNKLLPQFDYSRDLLKAFQDQYWTYYNRLLDFKNRTLDEQKALKGALSADFDVLFSQKTGYDKLDRLIQRSKANKKALLAVLDNPALPLHNNAAELAVRQIVRKRDISLHTWSERGTKVRDAFLSIIETANKLGVSAIAYVADRISKRYCMQSLASLVTKAYAES